MSVLEIQELWIRVDDPVEGPSLLCVNGEAVLGRDLRCDVVRIGDEIRVGRVSCTIVDPMVS